MTHVAPRKPFYRVTELCARWSMTETDIAAFVLADELTLSIAVSQSTTANGARCRLAAGGSPARST